MQYEDISMTLRKEFRTEQYQVSVEGDPGFGALRSDHLFLMDFNGQWENNHEGQWSNPRIVPYRKEAGSSGPFDSILQPGSKIFHYGYGFFEGAKAFQHANSELYAFRLDKNAERFNCSARIMNMPVFPEEYFTLAIEALLDLDRLHFPMGAQGASLYIRPFMFGTSDKLGVTAGNEFTFGAFLSPSGPYYSEGFNPISLLYQNIFHRATPGGVGGAKAAGNYAGASRPATLAKMFGASQCLFVDAVQNILIEEAGTSAVGVRRLKEVITPRETDTILGSITAGSARRVVNKYDFGDVGVSRAYRGELKIDDVISEIESGVVSEMMGMGTAAVISPVKSILILKEDKLDSILLDKVCKGHLHVHELLGGKDPREFYDEVKIGDGKTGAFTKRLFETYTGIQNGTVKDELGFLKIVPRRR